MEAKHLTHLPLDLFFTISSFLPESDAQCLRNTCRGLRRGLPHARLQDAKSGLWEDVMEQPLFLIRLLKDMPVDLKKGLSVCRRCVRIKKRWEGSAGEVQTNLMNKAQETQGEYAYGGLESMCDDCVTHNNGRCLRYSPLPFRSPEWCTCDGWCGIHGRNEATLPQAETHFISEQQPSRTSKLSKAISNAKEGEILCRRCDEIKSPWSSSTSDTDNKQSLTLYNTWDSICTDCMKEYENLALNLSIGGLLFSDVVEHGLKQEGIDSLEAKARRNAFLDAQLQVKLAMMDSPREERFSVTWARNFRVIGEYCGCRNT